MKEKLYTLSFEEANQFLKLTIYDHLKYGNMKQRYNRVQKIIKKYRFLEITNLRFSWLFIKDLMLLNRKTPADQMSIHSILQEIEIMEGLNNERSHTGKQKSFKGYALKGLYKKHYLTNSSDLLLTKELFTGISKDIKNNVHPIQAVEDNFQVTLDRLSREKGKLAEYITGEWLVFYKHENTNYYVCLWEHNNNDSEKAKEIKKYVVMEKEPYLKKIIGDS